MKLHSTSINKATQTVDEPTTTAEAAAATTARARTKQEGAETTEEALQAALKIQEFSFKAMTHELGLCLD